MIHSYWSTKDWSAAQFGSNNHCMLVSITYIHSHKCATDEERSERSALRCSQSRGTLQPARNRHMETRIERHRQHNDILHRSRCTYRKSSSGAYERLKAVVS